MFDWLKKKHTDYKMKNHISKESCFVFPIIAKEMLEDGARYITFDITHTRAGWKLGTETARWCAEKDCFLYCSSFMSYENFKPIRKSSWDNNEGYVYDIVSYNPCDINALDIEELKDIVFNVGDDTTIESDDIWEKLIDYLDKRGLSD